MTVVHDPKLLLLARYPTDAPGQRFARANLVGIGLARDAASAAKYPSRSAAVSSRIPVILVMTVKLRRVRPFDNLEPGARVSGEPGAVAPL